MLLHCRFQALAAVSVMISNLLALHLEDRSHDRHMLSQSQAHSLLQTHVVPVTGTLITTDRCGHCQESKLKWPVNSVDRIREWLGI